LFIFVSISLSCVRRSRANVDFKIVEHVAYGVTEVITYCADKHEEGARIYLSTPILKTKVNANELEDKLQQRKEAFVRQRKRVPVDELTDEITRNMYGVWIIQRAAVPEGEEFNVTLVPQTGDLTQDETGQMLDAIILEVPEGLVPLSVPRFKRASTEEFHATLATLKSQHMDLKDALMHANRVSGIMMATVEEFDHMVHPSAADRSTMDPNALEMSRARLRWRHTIKKVQFGIAYEKTKQMLEKRYSLDSIGTLPSMRSSTLPSLRPSLSMASLGTTTDSPSSKRLLSSNSISQLPDTLPAISEGGSTKSPPVKGLLGKSKLLANSSSKGSIKSPGIRQP
jgi:hypothetical protein